MTEMTVESIIAALEAKIQALSDRADAIAGHGCAKKDIEAAWIREKAIPIWREALAIARGETDG